MQLNKISKTTEWVKRRRSGEKKKNEGKGRRTDLEHEFAHGFELLSGVVLPVKKRVIGHLPQLHHDVTQLSLCAERARVKSLPLRWELVPYRALVCGRGLTLAIDRRLQLFKKVLIKNQLFVTH